MSKRVALYLRVSTVDQHPETQLYDLRLMARQRGYQIVSEYSDKISGVKAKRPSHARRPPRPFRGRDGLGLRPDGALGPPLPRGAR